MRAGVSSGAMGALAGFAVVIAAAGVAVLLGLAPGVLSVAGAIAIAVVTLGVLAIVIFRRTLASADRAVPRISVDREAAAPGTATRSDPILRIPRLLFYAGALLIGQASLRPALGLTLSEIFFIAAFACAAIAVLAGRPMPRIPTALLIGVVVFALGGLISSPGAVSPASSASNVLQGVYVMLLWAWTAATVLRNRGQIVTALTLWTFSAAVDGFAAITQVLGADSIAGPLEGSRATGFTEHPNDLGGVCAIALVPALMLATSRFPGKSAPRGSFMRAPHWAILALVAAGLVLSASVGAMIAGFVAIVVWLMAPAVRAPGRVAVVTAIAFTVLAVMLAGGRVTSPTERVAQVTETKGTSATSGSGGVRVKTIERTLPRIADDPLVGTGLDAAGGTVNVINQGASIPNQVHGQPVAAWYQAGFFGFLGVLIVVLALARYSWRAIAAGDQHDQLIGLAIFAAFVAFIIHAMSTPFDFQQYQWITGALLIAWTLRRDAVAPVFVTNGRDPDPILGPPGPLPHRA